MRGASHLNGLRHKREIIKIFDFNMKAMRSSSSFLLCSGKTYFLENLEPCSTENGSQKRKNLHLISNIYQCFITIPFILSFEVRKLDQS